MKETQADPTVSLVLWDFWEIQILNVYDAPVRWRIPVIILLVIVNVPQTLLATGATPV